MKKSPTITISCEGLSQKRINELADELDMLFEDVSIRGEHIIAGKPFSKNFLTDVNDICARYGVWLAFF